MRKIPPIFIPLALLLPIITGPAAATPTENIGIQVLPAPGPVVVDGKYNDWDLSGSVFASNDIERQRDDYAVWLSAMYDAKNLYVLARFLDKTPLNNPGQTIANYGFAGDSLQIRTITHPDTPQQLICNETAWRGRNADDVINMDYEGARPEIKDAKTQGGQQAFTINADGQGYVQEIALPWALLTKDGQPLHTGDQFRITFEPNFTTPGNGRLSVKEVFQPLPSIDRVFTFMAKNEWGTGTLAPRGHLELRPVRIAGGREFPTHLAAGVPVADWSGLTVASTGAAALPGFKNITFTMPADGFVSLNIKNADGQVVCHLLRGEQYTAGRHTVQWDGLTTPSAHQPGAPVPPGTYTWSALYHGPIGLKLRGWADNGGSAPWDSGPGSNWGGDHGVPNAAASEGDQVYLGWTAAEAGAALVATDLQGHVQWRNNRGGIAGAEQVAVDNGTVYVLNGTKNLYRLRAKDHAYTPWAGSDSADLNPLDRWTGAEPPPNAVSGMDAANGKIYLSFRREGLPGKESQPLDGITVLDGATGKFVKMLKVPAPGRLKIGPDDQIYVISAGTSVLTINPDTGDTRSIVSNLSHPNEIALDRLDRIYIGLGEPDNQVQVFNLAGKLLRLIGRSGGRPLLGPWQPDGMRFIGGMTVDSEDKLWVMEADDSPKRVSVWDTHTGRFVKEFFGPTHYGASGGVIDPQDPNIMVGSGCEWRLDPVTGQARCLAVITRDGMGNSRFGIGANGKLYLVVGNGGFSGDGSVQIFERLGDANYKLRARFTYDPKSDAARTRYWADANGDGQEQPEEVTTSKDLVRISGWYMWVTSDLTLYSGYGQYKVSGFTPAGAPLYDLAHPVKLPNAGEAGGMGAGTGVGSADGKLMLYNGAYGADRTTFDCYDIASGKLLWRYPNNYVGVHGSHNAIPPEPGMIRGAYDITGAAKLPAPVGNIWVIPTNVSEWHILTGDGFYLTRLFEPDFLKYQFPASAVPGADMTETPPGMGGEDFGGSMTQGVDGKLYLQAGKTAYWNLLVTGLESAKAIPGGQLALNDGDMKLARRFQEDESQAAIGQRQLTLKHMTPVFTGSLEGDFAGAGMARYSKGEGSDVRSSAAWDDQNLYLGWDVHDPTPWTNGAAAPENMYIGGDTVDFQLGTDPAANKNRTEAGPGDLRLSIGSAGGADTAMLYRKVSPVKHPLTFHSGVVANYPMDYVAPVAGAKLKVTRRGDGYTVEAAIPLAELGLTPREGLSLRGDFGVTYGNEANRTRLRNYWSNQHTGIVDDAVFELMLEPNHWGTLTFGP